MSNDEQRSDLFQLAPTELQKHCSERSLSDRRHERFCVELFRRAILQKDQWCWEALVQQYRDLVRSWAYQMVSGGRSNSTFIDELEQGAFLKLWQFYSAEHFAKASSLGAILDYLKSCVWTCIQEDLRFRQRQQWLLDKQEEQRPTVVGRDVADETAEALYQEQLWQAIDACCKSPQDKLLARLLLTTNLKPNEIYAAYPDQFTSVDDVYSAKRNLLARLSRDKTVRALWQENKNSGST